MNQSNLFVAVTLSLAVLLGFHFFYEKPRMEALRRTIALQAAQQTLAQNAPVTPVVPPAPKDRASLITASGRITIASGALQGSLNLVGARFDDLTLTRYRETTAPQSPAITLLSPAGSAAPHAGYYAEFGWLGEAGVKLPDAATVWQASAPSLTPAAPVTLTWDNGQGLRFEREIALDQDYMFTLTDRVHNTGAAAVMLHPFALLLHQTKPSKQELAFGHAGPMGVFDGILREHGYESLEEKLEVPETGTGGWLGVSDKYWLTALVPPRDEAITASFRYAQTQETEKPNGNYQVDYRGTPRTIAPQATATYQRHFFAGAKNLELLTGYSTALGIEKFELAIDFGWFRILTKPMLFTLNWLGQKLGNVGLAILALTIIVKLLVLPLGIKSYRSMATMKRLQPEMQRLQERFKEDRQRLSIEMMELYKREKVSPLSGCLPIIAQLPIFFALYKILSIGLDMRHAPFFGWIRDLAAPDPTSILNLFGLLPFTPPAMLQIGIWPILMGLSMFLLQKMSPQPTDPIQKQVITFMPLMFTVMFAPTMAAGLIIYWTWSNLISIAQQFLIFRNMQKH
jgi:YidC/Oxa1 family membrane protein insertase